MPDTQKDFYTLHHDDSSPRYQEISVLFQTRKQAERQNQLLRVTQPGSSRNWIQSHVHYNTNRVPICGVSQKVPGRQRQCALLHIVLLVVRGVSGEQQALNI